MKDLIQPQLSVTMMTMLEMVRRSPEKEVTPDYLPQTPR